MNLSRNTKLGEGHSTEKVTEWAGSNGIYTHTHTHTHYRSNTDYCSDFHM